jgi:hypothetical protein
MLFKNKGVTIAQAAKMLIVGIFDKSRMDKGFQPF